MTFTEQCSYKYLINSASIGYANKFKYLLLCGSVVIYVQDGMAHKEFYEYGLLPGVHYVSVPTADDVPAMVRWLKAHDSYARGVARAGRERLAALDEVALKYRHIPLHTVTRRYVPSHTVTYRHMPSHTGTYRYIPLHTARLGGTWRFHGRAADGLCQATEIRTETAGRRGADRM